MLKLIRLPKWLYKYTVAAILIAVPLYPKFPLLRVPGTFVSIRFEDLIIALAGLILLIDVSPNILEFLKGKVIRSIMLFLSVGLLSYFSSIFITKTVVPHIGILHWLRRVEYFIPLFLGTIAIRKNRTNVNYFFKLLLLVVFFCFVYGLGQRYFNWPIIITQNEEYSKGVALRWISGSHINSTFAGHYDLSTFLVLVLPILISALFLVNSIKSRLVILAVSLSGLWLLVNSASRISLVSYLGATTIALVLVKRYKEILFVAAASIVFVGFSSNLLSRYSRLFEVVMTKVKQIEIMNLDLQLSTTEALAAGQEEFLKPVTDVSPTPSPTPKFEDRSTNIRFNVEWPRALRAFSKNPLLGTGYSSITLATDNDYLRILGEIGILGFLAFFLIFVQIVKTLLKAYPFHDKVKGISQAFLAGIVGAIPGIFLNAAFIDVFEASKFATLFWLMMGIALELAESVKNEKQV